MLAARAQGQQGEGGRRTWERRLLCAGMECSSCFLRRSQILHVWSPPPVAMWYPFGEKLTANTCRGWVAGTAS